MNSFAIDKGLCDIDCFFISVSGKRASLDIVSSLMLRNSNVVAGPAVLSSANDKFMRLAMLVHDLRWL